MLEMRDRRFTDGRKIESIEVGILNQTTVEFVLYDIPRFRQITCTSLDNCSKMQHAALVSSY